MSADPSGAAAAGLARTATAPARRSPRLFGNDLARLSDRQLKPARRWIVASMIGHPVPASAPAVIANLTDAATVIDGNARGVPAWIGLVVTIGTGERIRGKCS
jgi:hypothetical protein